MLQSLLEELRKAGHIKARTKWKDVYPLFSKDERYQNLLGTPGSNPLELFWDVVDILDEALQHHAAMVQKVMTTKNIAFSLELSESDFLEAIKGDPSLEQLTEAQLKNVYQHVSDRMFTFGCVSD